MQSATFAQSVTPNPSAIPSEFHSQLITLLPRLRVQALAPGSAQGQAHLPRSCSPPRPRGAASRYVFSS